MTLKGEATDESLTKLLQLPFAGVGKSSLFDGCVVFAVYNCMHETVKLPDQVMPMFAEEADKI